MENGGFANDDAPEVLRYSSSRGVQYEPVPARVGELTEYYVGV